MLEIMYLLFIFVLVTVVLWIGVMSFYFLFIEENEEYEGDE